MFIAELDAKDLNPAKYRLFAFISHKGTSSHCGHYVAFVRRGGIWAIYNDNKVAEVENIEDFKGEGYVFFYERQQ